MARDPHEAVDFAPAWLNLNNSNKKKSEKTSVAHSPTLVSSNLPLRSPLKPHSQESSFRTNVLRFRHGGNQPRAANSSHWNYHCSSTRPIGSSLDFTSTYLQDRNGSFNQNSGRDHKGHSRHAGFTPVLPSAKSSSHLKRFTKKGPASMNQTFGRGDAGLDAEFPSLSDAGTSEQIKNKTLPNPSSGTVVNMWQKPLVLKTTEPEVSKGKAESTKSFLSSSIYKTLVPKTSHQKQPYRRALSVPIVCSSRNADSNGDGFVPSGGKLEISSILRTSPSTSGKMLTGNTSSLRLARSALQNSSSIGLAAKNGKNETDKAEEKTVEKQSASDEQKSTALEETDGEECEGPQFENSLLSSSLEAEHRFLREMGWKYSDEEAMDDEPPLTEDEIREFKTRFDRVSPTLYAEREKVLQNAFSGWKFRGIKKREENNNGNTLIWQKAGVNRCSSEEDQDNHSSDNEF